MSREWDEKKRYKMIEECSLFRKDPDLITKLKNNPNTRVSVDNKYIKGSRIPVNTEIYVHNKELHKCYNFTIGEVSVFRDISKDRTLDENWDYGLMYTKHQGNPMIETLNRNFGSESDGRTMNLVTDSSGSIILKDYRRKPGRQKIIDNYLIKKEEDKRIKNKEDELKRPATEEEKKKLRLTENEKKQWHLSCWISCNIAIITYILESKKMTVNFGGDETKIYQKAKDTKGDSAINGYFNMRSTTELAKVMNEQANIDIDTNQESMNAQTIIEDLQNNKPVMVLLAGGHAEVIYGYDGKVFLVDDVGYQGDTYIDPDGWLTMNAKYKSSTFVENKIETPRYAKFIKRVK